MRLPPCLASSASALAKNVWQSLELGDVEPDRLSSDNGRRFHATANRNFLVQPGHDTARSYGELPRSIIHNEYSNLQERNFYSVSDRPGYFDFLSFETRRITYNVADGSKAERQIIAAGQEYQ